jgi:uncharacterized protein
VILRTLVPPRITIEEGRGSADTLDLFVSAKTVTFLIETMVSRFFDIFYFCAALLFSRPATAFIATTTSPPPPRFSIIGRRHQSSASSSRLQMASSASSKQQEIVVIRQPDAAFLQSKGVYDWGTWGCGVSKFPWTYDTSESCYLLQGKVTVTPSDGRAATTFGKGDYVTFPAGMSCTWDVTEAVQKHYMFS